MAIVEDLAALKSETLAAIEEASDSAQLEQVRVAVLGKAGTLTAHLRSMEKSNDETANGAHPHAVGGCSGLG